MECVCHASLVWAYATYLNGMWCVGRATTLEGSAVQGDGMIPAGENKIANKTLISVDNEVSAEFLRFFVVSDEFCRRHGTNITANRLRASIKLWDIRRTWDDSREP